MKYPNDPDVKLIEQWRIKFKQQQQNSNNAAAQNRSKRQTKKFELKYDQKKSQNLVSDDYSSKHGPISRRLP